MRKASLRRPTATTASANSRRVRLPFAPSPASPSDIHSEAEFPPQIGANEVEEFGVVGHGTSGSVRSAVHLPTHRLLALKRIQVMNEREKRQQFLAEVKWLMELPESEAHSLVRFHGAFLDQQESTISIALEYVAGGSLQSHVRSAGPVPERVLAQWVIQLLEAFEYLHSTRKVVHRDVKPANVLLTLGGEPKLTDFGLAANVASTQGVCDSFRGTMCYMSPERVQNEAYSCSSDIWSLGLIVLEALTARYPYEKWMYAPFELILQICNGPSPEVPEQPPVSEELNHFICDCLAKDPEARPSAEKLLQHAFVCLHWNDDVSLAEYMRRAVGEMRDGDQGSGGVSSIANIFTRYYYQLFESQRKRQYLRSLYRRHSVLSADGERYYGPDAIVEAFDAFSNFHPGIGRVSHSIQSVDCQPLDAAASDVLISVQASLVGEEPQGERPEEFARVNESFILSPAELRGQRYISNQIRRLSVE